MKKRKTSITVGDTVCSCKLEIYAVYQRAAAADGICDQRGFRGGFPRQDAECINTCPACRILKTHYLWRYCTKKTVVCVQFAYNYEFERMKIRDNCVNIYCYH